jgi:hypothetical protein
MIFCLRNDAEAFNLDVNGKPRGEIIVYIPCKLLTGLIVSRSGTSDFINFTAA